jgi:hypothetical protein
MSNRRHTTSRHTTSRHTTSRHTTSHRTPPLVPLVRPSLQEELRQAVAEAVARHEQWAGSDAAAWLGARLGHAVSYHVGWRYLVRAKHSLQVLRPRLRWPTPSSKTPSK